LKLIVTDVVSEMTSKCLQLRGFAASKRFKAALWYDCSY